MKASVRDDPGTATHSGTLLRSRPVLAGAGDELQAVKRGLLELADVLVVNKADGDNEQAARLAAAEFRRALPLLAPTGEGGPPEVMAVSAITGAGVDELWDCIVEHRRTLDSSALWPGAGPGAVWLGCGCCWSTAWSSGFESQPGLADRRTELEHAVEQGHITPEAAVDLLLAQL